MRTLGGHRRYAPDALSALRGDADPPATGLTVAYARVSSHDQREDLARQGERLLRECECRCYGQVEAVVVEPAPDEITSRLAARRSPCPRPPAL